MNKKYILVTTIVILLMILSPLLGFSQDIVTSSNTSMRSAISGWKIASLSLLGIAVVGAAVATIWGISGKKEGNWVREHITLIIIIILVLASVGIALNYIASLRIS